MSEEILNNTPAPANRRVLIEFSEGEVGIIQGILEDTLQGLEGVDTPRMIDSQSTDSPGAGEVA